MIHSSSSMLFLLASILAGAFLGLPHTLAETSSQTELIEKAENLFYSYENANRYDEIEPLLKQLEGIAPSECYAKWARARLAFFSREALYLTRAQYTETQLNEKNAALAKQCHESTDACLKLSSENAECHLLKGACYAMQASAWGVSVRSLSVLKPMDENWKKAIELKSTFQHHGGDVTTANLAYIFRAILYRAMPDSWWFKLFTGMRGSKEKAYQWAIENIRGSLLNEPMLVLERGVTALCYGNENSLQPQIEEGLALLKKSLELPMRQPIDAWDRKNSEHILQNPSSACDYRRERFEDLSSDGVSKKIK